MSLRPDSGDAESGLFVFGEGDCARKSWRTEIGAELSIYYYRKSFGTEIGAESGCYCTRKLRWTEIGEQ
jgi:hypothetical protein